jgi:glycerol-3-phosphate dehydrogenase
MHARPRMNPVDVAIVGAGAVGLATAWEAARRGSSVAVLERHSAPGTEQSTHNSGVIHAGFAATPGTLRARLNVEGARMIYETARSLGVPVEASGTLVVARTSSQLPRLAQLRSQGSANGVEGLRLVQDSEARSIEPHLGPCAGALFVPTGGRIDAVAWIAALVREVRRAGGELRTAFDVRSVERNGSGPWRLRSSDGSECAARTVVNAAGVSSGRVAALFGARAYRIYPCLGEYARIRGAKADWVRSMIYGIPAPGFPGIGVHLTRQTNGELLLGPTAVYQDSETAPDRPPTPLGSFLQEASGFLSGLALGDLEPAGMGVRAKPVPPGAAEPFADYVIREDPPGSRVLQLVGIESPGLTACLAVARHALATLEGARPVA